jgi:hypothetical protein
LFSLLSLPPLLRTIWTCSILLFSYMNTKHIHNFHSHSAFPYVFPLPTCTNPQIGPILPSCQSFFKVYIDSSREFPLSILDVYFHALVRFILPVTYLFSITMLSYYSTAYSTLCYIHIQMGCFNSFHSLIFSSPLLPPIVPPDRPTNVISISLSLSACLCMH